MAAIHKAFRKADDVLAIFNVERIAVDFVSSIHG
jgi:hypothetical protein